MNIKKDLTKVNITPRNSRSIEGIVLHSMWGTQAGSIAWFKNPQAQASAHYCISAEGEIVQTVEDKDIAWHAGVYDEPIPEWCKPNPNWVTIGIELEDRKAPSWQYPEPQRQALRELLNYLMERYNIPKEKVLLHKNLNPSRRSDPVGEFSFDWVWGGGDQDMDYYKGYDLTNKESMKVAVDILVRVQGGEFVDKKVHEDLQIKFDQLNNKYQENASKLEDEIEDLKTELEAVKTELKNVKTSTPKEQVPEEPKNQETTENEDKKHPLKAFLDWLWEYLKKYVQ